MTLRTLTPAELSTLLVRLSERVSIVGEGFVGLRCDGDLMQTRRILESLGKTPGEVRWIVAELREVGGYCDCEVLQNLGAGDPDDDPDELA
ncbi:MAG: DUF2695 domain-containing protein [Planctomycetes bacterium]|nr:DUF2695 domain-containing protein [Planctomycetota bacterium]MBI3845805.1 DUF2695 domain-containing protein [Planctomycetota bacterium]